MRVEEKNIFLVKETGQDNIMKLIIDLSQDDIIKLIKARGFKVVEKTIYRDEKVHHNRIERTPETILIVKINGIDFRIENSYKILFPDTLQKTDLKALFE